MLLAGKFTHEVSGHLEYLPVNETKLSGVESLFNRSRMKMILLNPLKEFILEIFVIQADATFRTEG